jgi:beta-galactosidase GanA
MWPELFQKSKEAGINAIDTYVFWNYHEEREGLYDFETDNANLPLFLRLAQEHGLYVVLRIGPYVCKTYACIFDH